MHKGRPVHFELDFTATTTAAAVVIYGVPSASESAAPVISLASNERLIITDVILSVEAGALVELFADHDGDGNVDDGERIVGGFFGDTGGAVQLISARRYCKPGQTPKIKGDTDVNGRVIGHGFIEKVA